MQKKISPIDPESIFAQYIGLRKFSEASQGSKLGRSEINSLFAAVGSRALKEKVRELQLRKLSYLNARYRYGTVVHWW